MEREIALKKYQEEQAERDKEYQAQKEKEEAEWKAEQEIRTEAISKLVGFVTDKVTECVNFDYQKKLLSYHATFSAMDLFRELDTDHDNYVTS
jgi:predicted Holliday junction resolvase-like endonuclease